MEFPEVGEYCAVTTCSQLDFLPFTCDACKKIFCIDHRQYENHSCEQGRLKNVTVPVCPLCNEPVPTKRDIDPNVSVNEHIANDCQSDKAKKVYTNRCSHPGCKKKELVPVVCEKCGRNYCLRHRLDSDHNCVKPSQPNRHQQSSNKPPPVSSSASRGSSRGPQATYMSQAGSEMNRLRKERNQQQLPHGSTNQRGTDYSQLQGMTEDEALSMAMAASLGQTEPPKSSTNHKGASGYDEDAALAKALAASLQLEEKEKKRKAQSHQQQQRKPQKESDGCNVS